jgi:hypothetical protein
LLDEERASVRLPVTLKEPGVGLTEFLGWKAIDGAEGARRSLGVRPERVLGAWVGI